MRVTLLAVGRLKRGGGEAELATRYRDRFNASGRQLGFGPLVEIELTESRAGKADARRDEEAARLLDPDARRRPKVVNVGVIGNIVKMLTDRGIDVVGTDEDPVLVGSEIQGVPIYGEDRTAELVEESDVAIITGMIISTDTMEDIVEAARRGGTKLVMFCETGANLCEEYVRLGVDAAVAEPFPFYIFGDTTRIDIYRRERT